MTRQPSAPASSVDVALDSARARGSQSPRAAARRGRGTAIAALAALVLVSVAALAPLRPPSPLPATTPAAQFSAARAIALLDGIATVPHPAGSAAAADVRAHLVDELRALGVIPRIQRRVAARAPAGARPAVATVHNVRARIPGTRPTGRVLLVAHYDSVPTGPGASDNGANVAALVEVARALRAGPRLRNDVEVLFTDAEEAGLLGAQGYVDSPAFGDPQEIVVLNLEARGVTGPAVMFQMAGGGLASAVRASDAVTTSFAAAVYQILPNDTDLTVFAERGVRGLNFAFMDGAAHYHTPHDDIAHLSAASVQDMGEATLGAVRHLADADLAERAGDAVYFSLPGGIVAYPSWLVTPLTGAALAAYAMLLATGRRRGLRLAAVARAAAGLALVVAVAVATGLAGWWLLTIVRPELGVGVGVTYDTWSYLAVEGVLVLAALLVYHHRVRRRASADEVLAGVLCWLVTLAVALAVVLPDGAYMFTWPALSGCLALAGALRVSSTARATPMLVPIVATGVPATALILPIAALLVPALGLWLASAPLVLAALVGATWLGVLEPLPERRTLTVAVVGLLAVGATVGVVELATQRFDVREPRPVSLAYVLDADAGDARWVSVGGPEQPAIGDLLTADPVRLDESVPTLRGWELTSGPAPTAAGVVAPRIDVRSTAKRDDVTTFRVRVRVPDDAVLVDVFVDAGDQRVVDATVDGAAVAGGVNLPSSVGPWRWGFRYAAPPPEGITVALRTRGTTPPRLRVVSVAPGLPDGTRSLPADVSWTSWPVVPAQTLAVRTADLR